MFPREVPDAAAAEDLSRRFPQASTGLQRRLQELPDDALHARGAGVVVHVADLVHVGPLAGLQLHRLDAIARVAVVAGDVAALEAAVDDETVVLLSGQHAFQPRLQGRRTARAGGGAEV